MKSNVPCYTEADLFRLELVNIIDLRHELVKLSKVIDWETLEANFSPLYSENG